MTGPWSGRPLAGNRSSVSLSWFLRCRNRGGIRRFLQPSRWLASSAGSKYRVRPSGFGGREFRSGFRPPRLKTATRFPSPHKPDRGNRLFFSAGTGLESGTGSKRALRPSQPASLSYGYPLSERVILILSLLACNFSRIQLTYAKRLPSNVASGLNTT